jgi:uncharacterized protein YifE (UPF0438 family)
MVDLDNFVWDKLSIICYKGGYGGDFLCNLLYQNYNENHIINPYTKENRFDFGHLDTGYMHPCLKNMKDFIFLYKIRKGERKFEDMVEIAWYKYLDKINNILYDENEDIYTENVANFIREVYYQGYMEKKYIARTHYHQKRHIPFEISKIFPGANIFLLVTNNMAYHTFFNVLTFAKNRSMYHFKSGDPLLKKFFTQEDRMVKNTFNNMIPIDVGKLYFESGYEIEAENILSNTLKKKIILNKQLLEKYKKDNMTIIENIIGKKNMENANSVFIAEKVSIFLEKYKK